MPDGLLVRLPKRGRQTTTDGDEFFESSVTGMIEAIGRLKPDKPALDQTPELGVASRCSATIVGSVDERSCWGLGRGGVVGVSHVLVLFIRPRCDTSWHRLALQEILLAGCPVVSVRTAAPVIE